MNDRAQDADVRAGLERRRRRGEIKRAAIHEMDRFADLLVDDARANEPTYWRDLQESAVKVATACGEVAAAMEPVH